MTSLFAVVLLTLAGTAPLAEGGVYRWQDETGALHFTNDPSRIPERFRENSRKLRSLSLKGPGPAANAPPKPSDATSGPNEFTAPLTIRRNQFFVKVILNEKVSANLLLDTGAMTLVLSENIGKQLGFRSYATMPQVQAHTVAGKVWTPLINLEKVRVGEARVEEVEAVISLKLSKIDGLLGMSFLGQFQMNLDRSSSRLTLKPLTYPGEILYDGQPKQWWREKFSTYSANIEYHQKLTRKLRRTGDLKAVNVEQTVRHYRKLYHELKTRARRAGVPQDLQPAE